MRQIGYSLLHIATSAAVWSGGLPARIELRDGNGALTFRGDFDKVGLVAPSDDNQVYRLVERWEIEATTETAVRGTPSESFDGEKIVVDPNWTEPGVP